MVKRVTTRGGDESKCVQKDPSSIPNGGGGWMEERRKK